jgi:hypothetical protein
LSQTISNGTDSVTPEQIDGYESVRASRTLTHTIIAATAPGVSLFPAGTRTGTLTALTVDRADALELEGILGGDDVLTLEDDDDATLDMDFVTVGDIKVTLDPTTLAAWLVEFSFVEVIP